jgi:hypothetical protein
MIRRAVLVSVAAVALILFPSAAMAYNAPGYSSSVSDPTPAIGHPVTVTVNGGSANARQRIKLVITPVAGPRKPHTKANVLFQRANANGVVKFTFKLNALGVYKVEAFNAAGALLSDQTLTVVRGDGHGRGDGHDNGHANANDNGHENENGREKENDHGDSRGAFASSPLNFADTHKAGLAAGVGALLLPGAGAMVLVKRRRAAKLPA